MLKQYHESTLLVTHGLRPEPLAELDAWLGRYRTRLAVSG